MTIATFEKLLDNRLTRSSWTSFIFHFFFFFFSQILLSIYRIITRTACGDMDKIVNCIICSVTVYWLFTGQYSLKNGLSLGVYRKEGQLGRCPSHWRVPRSSEGSESHRRGWVRFLGHKRTPPVKTGGCLRCWLQTLGPHGDQRVSLVN